MTVDERDRGARRVAASDPRMSVLLARENHAACRCAAHPCDQGVRQRDRLQSHRCSPTSKGYFAAYILDPDGTGVEAVFRERVEQRLGDAVRFAFRHFPLTEIHPHALAAALAAEAAALQGRFWDMHDVLFRHQAALEGDDVLRYAFELELDLARFDADLNSAGAQGRVRRDVESGIASGEIRGTPTLFIDGVVHSRGYDADALLEALAT